MIYMNYHHSWTYPWVDPTTTALHPNLGIKVSRSLFNNHTYHPWHIVTDSMLWATGSSHTNQTLQQYAQD